MMPWLVALIETVLLSEYGHIAASMEGSNEAVLNSADKFYEVLWSLRYIYYYYMMLWLVQNSCGIKKELTAHSDNAIHAY